MKQTKRINLSDMLAQLEKAELASLFEIIKPKTTQDIKLAAAERERYSDIRKDTGVVKQITQEPGTMIKHGLQNTKDAYAKANIVPYLTNTSLYKAFGSLSPEQQQGMENAAINYSDKLKQINWTYHFYSTILKGPSVKLTTLMVKPEIVIPSAKTVEDFYTNYSVSNYAPLFEDTTTADRVISGTRSGDDIYLNTNNEVRAYVRSEKERGLFIGAVVSGARYVNFTQLESNISSEEGLKLKNFASSILDTVKQKVFTDIEPFFRTDNEKAFLNTLKTSQLSPVFMDSLFFGLVDVMNIPLSVNYGVKQKAGEALRGFNVLNNQMYGESLAQSNPPAASAIISNLDKCMTFGNPFLRDLQKLMRAASKARYTPTHYNKLTNVLFAKFGDLLSKLTAICGTSAYDFDTIFCKNSPQDKIDQLNHDFESGSIFSGSSDTSRYPNPFIRILFTKRNEPDPAYIIKPMHVSALAFAQETKYKSKSGTLPLLVALNSDKETVKANEWKGVGIPEDEHKEILAKAQAETGNISKASYVRVLSSLADRDDTSQNAQAGKDRMAAAQLLNTFESLYNGDGTFKPNHVLFAIVPRVLFQGAAQGISTEVSIDLQMENANKNINIYKESFEYDRREAKKKALKEVEDANNMSIMGDPTSPDVNKDIDTKIAKRNEAKKVANERLALFKNVALDDTKDEIISSITAKMVPLTDVLNTFLTHMYTYDMSSQELVNLQGTFKIIVRNIQAGYWTMKIPCLRNTKLGLISLLKTDRGDFNLNQFEDIETSISHLRQELIDIKLAEQATEQPHQTPPSSIILPPGYDPIKF